ncbi:glycosyltransferase family 4 protein [Sinomonas sp. P47F7]|uniref:glycosyltransferase family 4 protein n=1 Tax=Sinomonas sp. P47F7 TaxID=3410987 RepID=UPI003BF5D36F
MKILMLSNNYVDKSRGGVELHVYNLARELSARGHDVHVVRTSPGASLYDDLGTVPMTAVIGHRSSRSFVRLRRIFPIPAVRFVANFLARVLNAIHAARELKSLRDRYEFDIIHHHDFVTSVLLGIMLKGLPARHVWTNHLGEFLYLRKTPLIGRQLTRLMTKVFTQGMAPSKELVDQEYASCPMTYIPNGVDVERFHPATLRERDEIRLKWNFVGERIVVIPRRWAPTKGVIYAAQAILTSSWPGQSLAVFAGASESDFPEYSAEIRGLLEDDEHSSVLETLSADEMSEVLRAADVCVIPSLMEATSLSALEAMASAIPIVGTTVGGLPELLSNRPDCRLVRPRDPQELATAVAELCNLSQPDRDSFGLETRNFVVQNYSWAHIASEAENVYKAALN